VIMKKTPLRLARLTSIVLLLFLILLPVWFRLFPEYVNTFISEMFFYMAFSMAINLVIGFTGYLPFGLYFFIGIGSYVYAVSIVNFGLCPFLGLVNTAVIGLFFAFLFGLMMGKIKGAYFAIGTFALAESMKYFFTNWGFVGYGSGLSMAPVFDLQRFYSLSLLILLITSLTFYFIRRNTRLRIMMTAIKVNEDTAKIIGINVNWPKILVMVLAGTYASILGAIWGQYQTFIAPSTVFSEMFIVVAIASCLLGGMGTLGGPILGTVIFLVIRELSWFVFPDFFLLALGLSLIVIINYFPNGVYPYLKKRIASDPDGPFRIFSRFH